jgi:hypothetical protein
MEDPKVIQQIAAEASVQFCVEPDLVARIVQFAFAQLAAYKLANPEAEKVGA